MVVWKPNTVSDPLLKSLVMTSSLKRGQHEQGVTTFSANAANFSISLQIADDRCEHRIGGINTQLEGQLAEVKEGVLTEQFQYRIG